MNLIFRDKTIEGILSILPKKTVYYDKEMKNYNFTIEQSLKLKKLMGYKKRMVVANESTADLCYRGMRHILKKKYIKEDEIDSIIVVTQTPEFQIPPTSNLIQKKFNLKNEIICLDINQGCAGYVIGLMQGFLLLNQKPIKKVLLFNVDTLSKKVSLQDRNSNPLIGDAASITLLTNKKNNNKFYFTIKMFTENNLALHIPAGGSKLPISKKTSILNKDIQGNYRSLNNLIMHGDAIFNFVQNQVPKVILDNVKFSKYDMNQIDKFIFHQPNKFVLKKLINILKIPLSKAPCNIVERFGNSSGPTIPLTIAFNIKNFTEKKIKMCMAGFGSGLTAASVISNIPKLKFCEIIKY